MSERFKDLEADALALPARERARLAHRLIESLDAKGAEDSREVEDAWGAEIESRVAAYRAGEIEAVPASDVMEEARSLVESGGGRSIAPDSRPWGFSTGALALADFRKGLDLVRRFRLAAVELSALRLPELPGLLVAFGELDLSPFPYVSLHFPNAYPPEQEAALVESLRQLAPAVPVVVHPDTIRDFAPWRALGTSVLVENMDRRKPLGRTVRELDAIFERLPDARLCFDMGHARHVDSSMTEAFLILDRFGDRLAQVHLSEVSTAGRHGRLSRTAILAFREVAPLIPPEVPVILESPVTEDEIADELARAEDALPLSGPAVAYG